MNARSPQLLIIAERLGTDRWEVYGAKRSGAVVPAGSFGEESALVSLAARMADESGGPSVRAVVFVTEQAPEREAVILVRYPRLVCRLSRMQAFGYGLAQAWQQFVIFDNEQGQAASLLTRTRGAVVEQSLRTDDPEELEATLRCLGVKNCVVVAGAVGEMVVPAGMEAVSAAPNEWLAGAAAFATEALSDAGVSVECDEIQVHAERKVEYSVLRPARPVLDAEEPAFARLVGTRPLLLVSDLRVGALYASHWRRYVRRHRLELCGEVLLDVSERSKTWQQVDEVCAAAARAGLPRDGVLAGVGGGVVLDVAGMSAALFRRGVDYVRVPTTLVGLVDVAVGIKQGVNAYGKKNLLGVFYPPLASLNDYSFLLTLPHREIACGLAEIVKMAALRDPLLFRILEDHGRELAESKLSHPAELATEVTRRAELLMLEELAPNLFEEQLARLVDFGHTFSPAIEIASNFEIPHGHAVGFDMLLSTALAVVRGLADGDVLRRFVALFADLGLPVWTSRLPDASDLLNALGEVRRHRGGALNLVVVSEPGRPHLLQSVSLGQITDAIERLLQSSEKGFQAGTAAAAGANYDRAAV